MIICEFKFYLRDPDHPDYSMEEVDIYGGVPPGRDEPNHRLSIRKNLKTGEFEAYRRYHQAYLGGHYTPEGELIQVEVKKEGLISARVFHGSSLEEVVKFTNGEVRRFHGGLRLQDQVCIHHEAKGADFCDAARFLDTLVCPICGKEYQTVGEIPDTKRLSGHLTGKHWLKGDDFFLALGQAEVMKIKASMALKGY